jgi:hypothetical protein
MAYLANFQNSDGLDPIVIAKLNENFRAIIQMIPKNEVVMVAQALEPQPRTDETLWYNTDTGALYIWAYNSTSNEWEWTLLENTFLNDQIAEYVFNRITSGQYLIDLKSAVLDYDAIFNALFNPQSPRYAATKQAVLAMAEDDDLAQYVLDQLLDDTGTYYADLLALLLDNTGSFYTQLKAMIETDIASYVEAEFLNPNGSHYTAFHDAVLAIVTPTE